MHIPTILILFYSQFCTASSMLRIEAKPGHTEYTEAIRDKNITALRKVAENESFCHLEARALLMTFLAQESFQEEVKNIPTTESNEWLRWLRLVIIQYLIEVNNDDYDNGAVGDNEIRLLFPNTNSLRTGSSRFSLCDLAQKILVLSERKKLPPTLIFLLAVALEREGGQIEPIRKKSSNPIEMAISLYKSIPEHGPSLYRLANLALLSYDTGCSHKKHQYQGITISSRSEKFDNPIYQAYHWIQQAASKRCVAALIEHSKYKTSLLIEYINEIRSRNSSLPTPTPTLRSSTIIPIPKNQSLKNDIKELEYYIGCLMEELDLLKRSFIMENDILQYPTLLIRTHKLLISINKESRRSGGGGDAGSDGSHRHHINFIRNTLQSFNQTHNLEEVQQILKSKRDLSYQVEEMILEMEERISYHRFFNLTYLNCRADMLSSKYGRKWRRYKKGTSSKRVGADGIELDDDDDQVSDDGDQRLKYIGTSADKSKRKENLSYLQKLVNFAQSLMFNYEWVFDYSNWTIFVSDAYEQYTNHLFGLLMMCVSWVTLTVFRWTKEYCCCPQ